MANLKPKSLSKDDNKYDGTEQQFKIYVGIDFGTDGCGLAYALNDGTSYIHNTWKDVEPTQKPRTSVLFDNNGNVQCIGNQAAMQYITSMSNDGWKLFERFKMSLFETPSWKSEIKNIQYSVQKVDLFADQIQSTNDPNLFELSEKVFVAQLKYLREQAIAFMKKNFKRKKKLKYNEDKDIQWILTVPAIWSDKAKQQMKDWAIKAKLINGTIRNQLKIVYEPDCASLSIQTALINNTGDEEKKEDNNMKMIKSHRPHINIDAPFNKGDKYILVDVGGGTCDIASHEILGPFKIAEVLHPSGGPWGGGNIDREFINLLHKIFNDNGIDWMDEFITNKEQEKGNKNMYQQLLQNFIEMSKPTFYDYVAMNREYHTITVPYNFANFLIEKFEELMDEQEENENEGDETKEGIDFVNDFLAKKCQQIYGRNDFIKLNEINYGFSLALHNDLWMILFDSIINPIINHCKQILLQNEMKQCKYIFLVGGLANSKYFQFRMKQTFDNKICVITPELPQLCVVDGAARYGLRPNFMKIRRLSKTYGIQSNKLKSKIDCNKFPDGFIERKSYHNKQKNKDFVENCFNAFVRKNHAINIDDKPIRRPVYKIKHDQKQVNIVIYSSNKEEPQTADPLEIKKYKDNPESGEDCDELARFIVKFDENSNDKVWVEFSYSDTLLTVHAYPDKQYDKRQEIHIEYQ